ncbi:hypothetical protein GCM10010129_58470 [Streptomyces fumigatiscleroticus]|nr:hypothetical protein GCM10010129_58470 [Streptomyces fumigatiscleroticus]
MTAVATREQIVAAADRLFYHHGYEPRDSPTAPAMSANEVDAILDAVIDARLADTRRMLEQWEAEESTRPAASCTTSRSS